MTRFYRTGRLVALAASGLIASACADSVGPLAPPQAAPTIVTQAAQDQANGGLLSGLVNLRKKPRVSVLTRRSPLKRDYVVSADIGPAGGSLQIDDAGVSITFPKNAVSVKTRITMRALAGRTVAYEFEPHGLTFVVKPIIEQDLDKTNWYQVFKGGVEGVYFADPASLDQTLGEADADEFFLTTTKGDKILSFSVPHFSGYLVSSARR
jgi:hypothetical protein